MALMVHKKGLDKEMTVQYTNAKYTLQPVVNIVFFSQMPNKETTECDLGVHGIPPTRNSAEFFDF
jgi:hypothetical protein